jgi:adenosyl cobinamide kinase/adenosyl cobinamide phosphate guanylyltransferase
MRLNEGNKYIAITKLQLIRSLVDTFHDERDNQEDDFVEDDQLVKNLLHRSKKESIVMIDTIDNLIRDRLAVFATGIARKKATQTCFD